MDLDHWKQLDSLLQSVLERPPEERDAFLRQACAGDEPLERRVRALLSAEPDARHFLERPAIEEAARSLANEQNGNASAISMPSVSNVSISRPRCSRIFSFSVEPSRCSIVMKARPPCSPTS